MSTVFDNFPGLEEAKAFAQKVRSRYRLDAQVFMDTDEAHEHVSFPWIQVPPVVHVDGADEDGVEMEIMGLVEDFGGRYRAT